MKFEFCGDDRKEILENCPMYNSNANNDGWVMVNADDLDNLGDDSIFCPKCKNSDLKWITCNDPNLYSGSCEWTCKRCKHVIGSTFNSVPTQNGILKQGTNIDLEEQIQKKTNVTAKSKTALQPKLQPTAYRPWRMQRSEMTQIPKPRFKDRNNCFCPCGNNDPSKLSEEFVNNETILKCGACFSLLGDTSHHFEPKRCSLNRPDSTSTPDLLSVDSFGMQDNSRFCSCDSPNYNELKEEVINGITIVRCGICEKLFGDPNMTSTNRMRTCKSSSDLLEDVAFVEPPPRPPRKRTNNNKYSFVSSSGDKPPQVSTGTKGNRDSKLNTGSSSYNSSASFSMSKSSLGRSLSQEDILSAESTLSNWENTTLYQLFPGDHVRWFKLIIWPKYEGIVTDIDRNTGHITIVRNNPLTGVEENIINPIQKKIRLEKAIYTYQGFDPDRVVVRARSRLGERQYNLFKNNERQFATFCKSGIGGVVPEKSVPIQASKPDEYRKIDKFEQIQEGSHIKWNRGTYEHHAVIYKVYPQMKQVLIAHYKAVDWPQGMFARLHRIFRSGDLAEILPEKVIWDTRFKTLATFQCTQGTQTDINTNLAELNNELSEIEPLPRRAASKHISRSCQTTTSYFSKLRDTPNTQRSPQMRLECQHNKKCTKDCSPTIPGSTFIAHYSGQVYPVEKIQELVMKRLGETAYNVVRNNCEHFAISCCTGFSRSLQVQELAKHYAISFTTVSLAGLFEVLQTIIYYLPDKVVNTIFSSVEKIFDFGKHLVAFNLMGPLIQCIIMVVIKGIRIYKICKSHTNGNISRRRRNIDIGSEICEGVAGIGLSSVIGFFLGGIIPIPILGNILGAILGTVLGHLLGKFVKYMFLTKIDIS